MKLRHPKLVAAIALLCVLEVSMEGAQAQSRNASSASRSTSSASTARPASSGNYGSASGGMRQYRPNTMLGDAYIQVDPESRSVVVVTDEETHNSISKVIDNLDHPKPQVLIKVVFVEVALDKNLDIGIEGGYNFKVGHGTPKTIGTTIDTKTTGVTGNQVVTSSTTAVTTQTDGIAMAKSLFGIAGQTAGTFATLSSDNWQATLHMLESKGKAQVLSRPSIMARNNQEAIIVVGKEVPLVTASQVTSEGNTINSIRYQDVGIILRVTPFITSDKTVEMIVAPEISSLSDQTVPISNTVNAPVINKRSAETVVVTPNATTVVIGGLMQKETTSTVQKIPILGDIPLLGVAFRRTVKADTRSELLIFLTPYIVESTQTLKDLTLKEANQSRAIRENMSPEDIKDNLDTLRLMPELQPECRPAQVKTEATVIQTAPAPIPMPANSRKR
ncbi:MAG: hypothetical protein NTZ46_00250 [Verrucomicrobia bacterium]|nr:hypothetical protein [Verrucomicrobiota bacterium]